MYTKVAINSRMSPSCQCCICFLFGKVSCFIQLHLNPFRLHRHSYTQLKFWHKIKIHVIIYLTNTTQYDILTAINRMCGMSPWLQYNIDITRWNLYFAWGIFRLFLIINNNSHDVISQKTFCQWLIKYHTELCVGIISNHQWQIDSGNLVFPSVWGEKAFGGKGLWYTIGCQVCTSFLKD